MVGKWRKGGKKKGCKVFQKLKAVNYSCYLQVLWLTSVSRQTPLLAYLVSSTSYDGFQSHKLSRPNRLRASPTADNPGLPDSLQASFPAKAKNLTILFYVRFFACFELHSQSTSTSTKPCLCFGRLMEFGCFFKDFSSAPSFLELTILSLLCNESKPATSALKGKEQKEAT